MQTARTELVSTPSSVRTARSAVRTALQGWPHLQDTAALLVTELATNAVLHARGSFAVEVAVDGRGVRIAVSDSSPALPQRRRHGLEAGTGRGLGIVALLSTESGCDRTDDGPYRKTAWCRLPLDPAALPDPNDGALVA